MKGITHENATPGQLRQISRFVADAAQKIVEEFNLDKFGAQRVIERGDEVAYEIRNTVTGLLEDLSRSDKFEDEQVKSGFGYPSIYKPKSITEQMNRLRELFPSLGFADEKLADGMLPPNAEGWFAVPRWEKIASSYQEAVRIVLKTIGENRETYNEDASSFGSSWFGEDYPKQGPRSLTMWEVLGNNQKGHDILVVPAQFGIQHRGRSVRRADEVFASNEFGLGAFAVGIMILIHPERLLHHRDLVVSAAGDINHADGEDGELDGCMAFEIRQGLNLTSSYIDSVQKNCGSASGFLV